MERGTWYQILNQTALLPRYKYHCFLLNQFREGISKFGDLNKVAFNERPLTVVGNVNDKQKQDIFKNLLESHLSGDFQTRHGEDILMVYFFISLSDMLEDIMELGDHLPFKNVTALFIVRDGDYLKPILAENLKQLGITHVEFVNEFENKILYTGYIGDELEVITTDQNVKDSLLSEKSEFDITIKDNLEVEELTNTALSLHGAKHVYREESADDFLLDNSFATTGSLMKANKNSMIIVTARHGFKGRETAPIYVLIENEVVKLGGQMQQPPDMKYLHEDIAVVKIEGKTRKKVDAKCERFLFHDSEIGTPAQRALHDLKKGDIVHKRGAKTQLTTGVVIDIKNDKIGNFPEKSCVIFIHGIDDNKPFADRGDSGSLVYQHTLSPTEEKLEVHAMVQGRASGHPEDIICFPFSEGREILHKNIPELNPIDFFSS